MKCTRLTTSCCVSKADSGKGCVCRRACESVSSVNIKLPSGGLTRSSETIGKTKQTENITDVYSSDGGGYIASGELFHLLNVNMKKNNYVHDKNRG